MGGRITGGGTAMMTGLAWESILRCAGHDDEVVDESDPAGGAMGDWSIVSLPSPADPMWAPDHYETCPRCGGEGVEWQVGVHPEDVWTEACRPCRGRGEVRVDAVYIGTLSIDHRRNLYSWLMRRAPMILGAIVHSWYFSPFGMDDGLQHAAEEAEHELAADPWGWLASQPFMLALGALLIGDGNAGTVRAWERRAAMGTPDEHRDAVNAGAFRVAVAHVTERVGGAQARRIDAEDDL